MIDLNKLEQKEIIKGYKARFVHTEHTTLAFWEIDEGAAMPAHSHPHEQSSQVLEGKFELTIGSETEIYEKGLVAIIPSGIVHSGIAITACKILDVFYPFREDYKQITDGNITKK
jgi:quercetin dioxygenase-like cupin family protein